MIDNRKTNILMLIIYKSKLVDQCIITMLKTGQIDNVLTKGYQLVGLLDYFMDHKY